MSKVVPSLKDEMHQSVKLFFKRHGKRFVEIVVVNICVEFRSFSQVIASEVSLSVSKSEVLASRNVTEVVTDVP